MDSRPLANVWLVLLALAAVQLGAPAHALDHAERDAAEICSLCAGAEAVAPKPQLEPWRLEPQPSAALPAPSTSVPADDWLRPPRSRAPPRPLLLEG